MSDLVERLRHIADDDMWAKGDEYRHTIATAAERIEALETALRIIDDDLEYDSGSPGEFRAIIRKALAPEQDK